MKLLLSLSLCVCCLCLASGGEPKPIAVALGQEFKITLESNPTSGFQWLIAKPLDERLLKLLGNEYRRGRPGAVGAGGSEILNFKALGEGKTRIHLKYGRLFEKDDAPARTTNFVVVISREIAGVR